MPDWATTAARRFLARVPLVERSWHFLRAQRPCTAVFGPRWQRARRRIGIDLTWRCNVGCAGCNRSCGSAPSEEDLSLDQLERFIAESADRGLVWQRIRLLGGEPTMHPQFREVIELLCAYRDRRAPETRLSVVTNGVANFDLLSELGGEVEVESSRKDLHAPRFIPFAVAPQDTLYRLSDFTNGCWVTAECGIGLNRHGYYHCGIAGGIDRVMGLDIGRSALPDDDDPMHEQMRVLCALCGGFRYPSRRLYRAGKVSDSPPMSRTWKQAYQRYREQVPELRLY